ncbi:21358_t:CDS:10 [Rhizophagus irregularis]|nr:21358_t:CDS:10 [Rhizophagus irregularis]
MNGVYKGKKRRFDQISKENDTNYKDHEEYQYKKLRKALQDNSKHRYLNEGIEEEGKSKLRWCEVCELKIYLNCHTQEYALLIQFYGISKHPDSNDYFIVKQFHENTSSLTEYISHKFDSLNWEMKLRLLLYLSEDLKSLHNAKYVHRYYKYPSSVLVFNNSFCAIETFLECKALPLSNTDEKACLEYLAADNNKDYSNSKPQEIIPQQAESSNLRLSDIIDSMKRLVKFIKMNELTTKTPIGSMTSTYILKENGLVFCKRLKNGQLVSDESIKAFIHKLNMQNKPGFRLRIIPILGMSFDESINEHLLVMQYADSGNLRQFLKNHLEKLNWDDKINLIKDNRLTEIIDKKDLSKEKSGYTILEVTRKKTECLVVLKTIILNEAFIHELKMHKTLNSYLRIVPILGISLEYANGGNLRQYLKNQENLTWNNKIKLAYQITEGIKYLHDKDINHQSLYYKNIVIHKKEAKIILDIAKTHSIDAPIPGTTNEYLNLYKSCCDSESNKRPSISQVFNKLEGENILHRDLHSKNIVIHQGEAKIIDLGIAKIFSKLVKLGKAMSIQDFQDINDDMQGIKDIQDIQDDNDNDTDAQEANVNVEADDINNDLDIPDDY